METVFLHNGQECSLVKKLSDNEFIVNPVNVYTTEDGEQYQDISGQAVVVDQIFYTAPVAKINSEYLSISDKVDIKRAELRDISNQVYKLKSELETIKKTKTDLSRLIINRSEILSANRLSFFKDGHILPKDIPKEEFNKIKLSCHVSMKDGKFQTWYYQLNSSSDSYSSGDYIDEEYGIIINATPEELDRITKERVKNTPSNSNKFNDHALLNTPDLYLTEELILQKNKIALTRREREVKEATEAYNRALSQLQKLNVKFD